jgi:hypothetical protein
MLALATSKEIIEMDIKSLLSKNAAIDDECEMDILAINRFEFFSLAFRSIRSLIRMFQHTNEC